MPIQCAPSGSWRTGHMGWVYVVNTWRKLHNVSVYHGNVWRPVWTYAWELGPWSNCTATCGGGTQTRTVKCRRSDGTYVDDIHCTLSAP